MKKPFSKVRVGRQRLTFARALSVLAVTLLATPAVAQSVPPGFTAAEFASGLRAPTAMAFAPDGRLFVAEQGGRLRVIGKNGTLLADPFVTVPVDSAGERGLLGVAFHPGFATNGLVYVYYTVPATPRRNRISRFTASGNRALAGSEQIILELDPLSSATNHNGGAIHFGTDGKLYAAVGENANKANAQTLANLLGKMLRLNPGGSIPSDNPFYGVATGKNRAIWALGLRNPFSFDVHPRTGKIFINDVGLSTWEEINRGVAGANYGWPVHEGPESDPAYRGPIHAYRSTSPRCAITGGAFYAPPTATFPAEFLEDYFFADFCAGWIRTLGSPALTVAPFASGFSFPVDLKVDRQGRLYVLERGGGRVVRIRFGG